MYGPYGVCVLAIVNCFHEQLQYFGKLTNWTGPSGPMISDWHDVQFKMFRFYFSSKA
jgi:hypothetical protein